MTNPKERIYDVAVLGAGTAGTAASIFASQKGFSTIQIGRPSEMSFASGCLDLFSIIPADRPAFFTNPWKGIRSLLDQNPEHPFSKVSQKEIEAGFGSFSRFMETCGIRYHKESDGNQFIITPAGTLKPTWYVPSSMSAGSAALKRKKKILIVGIKGLKGFGADQMASTLKRFHPDIRAVTVQFPGREQAGDLMCERMAWDLETPHVLEKFAAVLSRSADNADTLGLPAILGVHRFAELKEKIESIIKKPVFEIPTLAPSVTGLRMKEAFLSRASEAGIETCSQTVKKIDVDTGGNFVFTITRGLVKERVTAEHVVLATGRFLGRGLCIKEERIHEALFDLPVTQPGNRSLWYERDFFDPQGHAVNRAGVETDPFFRPLDANGDVFHPRLFAAGGILAHQDWKREKSGSGISISSAFKAVSSIPGHKTGSKREEQGIHKA